MARLKTASIIGIFGGTGSGKSYKCKELIRNEKKLIVWDSMDEYGKDAKCRRFEGDLSEVIAHIRKQKQFRIAYVPAFSGIVRQFGHFCRIVRAVGNLQVVCEELNEITKPNNAPPDWKWLCSRGRHRGVKIIGLSQRPASVDKDFIGNTTEVYAGRLTYDRDWKSLASKFGKRAADIATLKNYDLMHWKG